MRHSLPIAIILIAANIALSTTMEREQCAPPPSDLIDSGDRRIFCAPKPTVKPVVVTSDSKAFCASLVKAIDEYKEQALSPMIKQMRDSGEDLCKKGMVRSGIVRLRRALISLKKTDDIP
ncbi:MULTISPECIES: hypothetical protein [Acetobacter]|uniref:Uncharacterized protein n=1 Tax=Acetobacter thailandicus TaxID=1502842 RepID=A0ABT3QBW4_9PROT|nr:MULTISPECIES: hypothetical protein [Acetobacter]MBS0959063.1 hypothetical protein [Acetobacter thailandicus]MBS0980417.1 hypothetical protein [Acetobacter thailandicus]MBS0985050.1 hypothetical protein [Acetobacter thailandicus]MBS1003411.1 hypothetical protein [Acetobacter thailandicus]MCX2562755.1 hypothetical protein [Acetobacter thailandicus]